MLKALSPILLSALAFLGCSSGDDHPDHPFSGFITQSVMVANLDGTTSGIVRNGLDILTANAVFQEGASAPGFLTTRLQDPATPGSFLDPLRSDTGNDPLAIAVGDVDGDGRPDVVVANYRADSGAYAVNVHLQSTTAAGTFLAPLRLSVGAHQPLDVALADLRNENRLDIVVAARGGHDVLVFFHDTVPGTFLSPVSIPLSADPASIAVANLTGSGAPDIVVALASGKVAVLRPGAAVSIFQTPVEYLTGEDPAAVKVVDLDQDGHPDILTANYANGTGGLSLLRQDPLNPGTFLAAVTYDTGDYASASLAIGDLDGDGHPDVVVANAGLPGCPGTVAVFRQDSAHLGTLLAPDLYRGYVGPLSVAIADLKGDGHPALVVADGSPAIRWPDPAQSGMFLAPVWLKQ